MRLLSSRVVFAALFTALLPGLALAAPPYAAKQAVPSGELLRWIYSLAFPVQCQGASLAVAALRVKPATDPATMHKTANSLLECTKTDWAKHHQGLYNAAIFGAAASALISARQETPKQALYDATFARQVSKALVGYTQQPNDPLPSGFRTEASQIHTDAVALIAAINAVAPASAAQSAAPH